MFTIYSDKDIFENIISSPGIYPNWNKIINNHSDICLDINEVDLEMALNDSESILFLFLQSNARAIDVIPLDNYFKTIYGNLGTILENPTSAFFLNISIAEAQELQERTGIIINCIDNINDDILSKGVDLDWIADDTINNNWTNILNPFNNFPSNSLIINDRNLFTNEERVDGTFENIGIDNLIRILDNLLPQNLKIDYHILIQSEQNTSSRNKDKCALIANDLNIKIRNLRNYNFEIEILFYCRGTNHFNSTHNRRIYSNYKYGKSENSLASFKIRNADCTRNDDSFNLVSFFNKIDSTPYCANILNAHEKLTSRYKELTTDCIDKLNKNGPNDRYYRYYLNGIEVRQGQSARIYNRLLN
jgi:hypothetical protein